MFNESIINSFKNLVSFDFTTDLYKHATKHNKSILDLSFDYNIFQLDDYFIKFYSKILEKESSYEYRNLQDAKELNKNFIKFYKNRYSYKFSEESEILAVSDNFNTVFNIFNALFKSGSKIVLPSPINPIYKIICKTQNLEIIDIPLLPENRYLIDLNQFSKLDLKNINCLVINYPNNPTGGVPNRTFYETLIEICKENEILIINDNSNPLISKNSKDNISIFSIRGGSDIAIEVFKLSNYLGYNDLNLSFVLGNRKILDSLKIYYNKIGNSIFNPKMQLLNEMIIYENKFYSPIYKKLFKQKDQIIKKLENKYSILNENSGNFLWLSNPFAMSSMKFAQKIAEETGTIIIPGNFYGRYGEGFIKINLSSRNFENILDFTEKLNNL